MSRSVQIVNADDAEAQLRAVLSTVEQLGVRWRQTRFETYLDSLGRRTRARRWVTLATDDDREQVRLDWEANTQAHQLTEASKVWPVLDQIALADKLKKVFSGHPLPPDDGVDDKPRNYLLELNTAMLLSETAGLQVELTRDREDLRVLVPDLGWMPVECKRPAGPKGVQKNIKKLRKQLRGRLSGDLKHGFAVLGIDRLVGAQSDFLAVRDRKHLIEVLDNTTRKYLALVNTIADRPLTRFAPAIPIAGLVFSGAVLLRDEELVCSVSQLGTFFPGDERRAIAHRVAAALRGVMETTPRSSPTR